MTSQHIWNSFRRWGYLAADLDSLGRMPPLSHADLDVEGEEADRARAVYCGPVGAEFMHIRLPERRNWLIERMEADVPPLDRRRILERLVAAETWEQVLQTRYLGAKRYSLEGATALIPLLDEILEAAIDQGVEKVLMAMSHRGRLNVVRHTVGRAASEIFAGFEDVDPRSVLGGGDVKYHLGATGTFRGRNGTTDIHLVSNPSHLEAVYPVAVGRARAKQDRLDPEQRLKILTVILHGDAAFAGQGIAAETLNMADLPGYTVGGTVHVIVNNLIGFTTAPRDLHSSRFSSDVARRLPIPIFHVNGEAPDAVVKVGRMALDFRHAFESDVVVDLIGYRRHGHSEVDDPTITQPVLYRRIADHPLLWQTYADAIGVARSEAEEIDRSIRGDLDAEQAKAKAMKSMPVLRELPAYWTGFSGGVWKPELEVDTAVPADRIAEIADRLAVWPDGFAIHPKVRRGMEQRREMGHGKRPVDWGMAEALAFGTLLCDGIPVRLSGQDSRRGTFNHRQSVLISIEDESEWTPLNHLGEGQAAYRVYDSSLSEASVMGFEYGYSRDYPEALVLWEAQFGDFVNGAQVIIDQFVSATEDKWNLLSGLVLLLPHGYEGQGPEHSSARLERFLQLAGEDNFQVAQPTNAAQIFHLLRRQALRKWRKPLVVMTPKSLLRAAVATSPLADLVEGRFHPVIPDPDVTSGDRLIFCTGKVGFELRAERKKRGKDATAIVFLEQLYPFPQAEVAAEIARHQNAREILWVQEEPANMGALFFVQPKLSRLAGGKPFRTVKRSTSASPATSSMKAHALEQAALLGAAFSGA